MMRKHASQGLIALACLAGCTPNPIAVVVPPQELIAPAPSVSSAAPDTSSPVATEMLAAVCAIRQLPLKTPVKFMTVDRSTLPERMKKRVREEVPQEVIRGQGLFLSLLGLLPNGFDFESGVYALMQSQLAGFYEPRDKTMFLIADLDEQESRMTLAHELVHALQDQHYDIDRFLRFRPEANDAQSAVQILGEGDATSAMYDFMLARSGGSAIAMPDGVLELQLAASMMASRELANSPSVLRSSLVAPYTDGFRFVNRLRRSGGWPAVDAVWRNPPTTTEQVLHPAKLASREPAESIELPVFDALPGSWRVVYSDVYGEQSLRLVLEEWMPKSLATEAAAGWAGDHVAVARRVDGPGAAAAWIIRFDPAVAPAAVDADAREALELIARAWRSSAKGDALCRPQSDGGAVAVLRRTRSLLMVAADRDALSGVARSPCEAALRLAAGSTKAP